MEYQRSYKELRSISRKEPRKLATAAIVGSLFLFICFISFIKPHFCPNRDLNFKLAQSASLNVIAIESKTTTTTSTTTSSETGLETVKLNVEYSPPLLVADGGIGTEERPKPICEVSTRSDFCEVEGDIRVQGNASIIFFSYSSPETALEQDEWKIQPYARKGDTTALKNVKELSIKPLMDPEEAPECTVNQNVPAIIFSIGGFTGNIFHDYTDVIIPLFITTHHFHGEIQLLITDFKSWWVNKHKLILQQISKYEIIDIDHDQETRCFPKTLMGLKFHKELSVNPSKSPHGYSVLDFKELLRNSFSLERGTAIQMGIGQMDKKPRLLIISRNRSRIFTNIDSMVEMAKSLDYEVIVAEANHGTDLSKFARLVNSCDVMMGVHGAGLTNMVFLPEGAVLIQIIPLGGLEWIARGSFKQAALDMKLKYVEYSIEEKESSLIDQYPHDHPVLRDPFSIHKKGWVELRAVYLDKQNVRPRLGRLRNTLLEAQQLLQKKN